MYIINKELRHKLNSANGEGRANVSIDQPRNQDGRSGGDETPTHRLEETSNVGFALF
jgi:hypothetical protein